MPLNLKNVKNAIDHFENDNFVKTKEILKKEFKNAIDDKVYDKVGIEKPLKVRTRITKAEKELDNQIADLQKQRQEMESDRIKRAEERAKEREDQGLSDDDLNIDLENEE